MKDIELFNNDVTSQSLHGTIARLVKLDVMPGSGTCEVHIWALKQLALEIKVCWEVIKELKQ